MVRRIASGLHVAMPNVDGWDLLLWSAIAVGLLGVYLIAGFAVACIVFGVIAAPLALLGSIGSGRTPPSPPEA